MPKALEFAWSNDKRIVDLFQLEVHLLFSEMTAWLSAGIGFEFKRGAETRRLSDAVDTVLSAYVCLFEVRFVVVCLSMTIARATFLKAFRTRSCWQI